VPADEITRTLAALGFGDAETQYHGSNQTVLDVIVPSWRIDVTREIDLIEEVARHFGYDRLPTTFPALDAAPAPPDPRLERDRLVRRLAAGAGFAESVTFSFIER
jgi:phenylalanyl-tRNA synthetase beta chain